VFNRNSLDMIKYSIVDLKVPLNRIEIHKLHSSCLQWTVQIALTAIIVAIQHYIQSLILINRNLLASTSIKVSNKMDTINQVDNRISLDINNNSIINRMGCKVRIQWTIINNNHSNNLFNKTLNTSNSNLIIKNLTINSSLNNNNQLSNKM
jgi:hypothetical protein